MRAIETRTDSPFYVTGGTLSRDAPCYVTRQADHQLYDSLVKGRFSYVLTARQMGKSSLMVRTASRFRDGGAGVVVLDLTAIGQNLTAEQWYGGLLTQMAQQLNLEDELEAFWDSHARFSPMQRWMQALKQVVLPRYRQRVVIFIDEIDAVRSLPFSTDEFFAGIREFYNHRSQDPELERLSFCLLGAAAPSDLIRDTRLTPFNIGERLELHDFSEDEAGVLAFGLGGDEKGTMLLRRILYWTGGHPYLTQRLCQAVAEANPQSVTGEAPSVDQLCDELFFSRRAREQDDNLLFVRERMLRSEVEMAGLLSLYEQVYRGKEIEDDEANPLISVLRLSGIVRSEEGRLGVRNRIYEQVFDRRWIAQNMPDAEVRRQRIAYRKGLLRATAIAAVIFVAIASLALVAIWQRNLARAAEETNRRQLYAAHMNLVARDWQDSNIEHMRDLLASHTPGPGQEDLRGFDWYLLWALAHPDLQTLPYSGTVLSLVFSSDLKRFAIGELTDVKLSEMAADKPLNSLKENGLIGPVVFSPDGKLLAADSADNSIRLWDIAAGRELRRFAGNTQYINALVFSRDGRMLASVGADQTTRIWEVGTGQLLATLKGHTKAVFSAAFSADGRKLATGSADGTVKVWEVATGKELLTLNEHAAKGAAKPPFINQVRFSPDDRRVLATGNFLSVAVWDAGTGQALPALEGHRSVIITFTFSDDGKVMATGSHDRTIRLWDVNTWNVMKTLTGHSSDIISLAFSNDGKMLASASLDKTIKLWDVEADANPLERPGVAYVAYAPDGKKLASALGKEVKLWNTTTWEVIATFHSDTAEITYVAYSPDGNLLALGSGDNTVRLLDISSGNERFRLKGHTGKVVGVAFSPDGQVLATSSFDKSVRLWEVNSGQELARLEGHESTAQAVAFSPDGRLLASTSWDTSVKLWEVATRRELATLKGHAGEVFGVSFSPDGKLLATTSADRTIRLWDVAAGKERSILKGHASSIRTLAFSPDGKRLASGGSDYTVRLWDVETGQELAALRHHTVPVVSAGFSPDGKTLVSGSNDGNLRVWRAATGQEVEARRR
jgi:WD40 repeat protein